MSAQTKKRILYLYNIKDWAIHNVGKLWFDDIHDFEIVLKNFKEADKKEFRNYDFVWFGYLDLYLYFGRYDLSKSILTIHDPWELFPSIKNWQTNKINLARWWSSEARSRWLKLRLLKKAQYTVTISQEMYTLLKKNYNVHSCLIPTASLLPIVEKERINTTKCNIISVFEDYPRKRIEWLKSIQSFCRNKLDIDCKLKVGSEILPQKEYTELLDKYEIYICTSLQEGGPLPAMDAMSRGAVVLTTPVGQIQELIENGKNGFICETEEDFIKKIMLFSENLNLLDKMRNASRDSIANKRNKKNIKQKVSVFLESL